MIEDRKLRDQAINWAVCDAKIKKCRDGVKGGRGFLQEAALELERLGYSASQSLLSRNGKDIKDGKREPLFPTVFTGRVVSRSPKNEVWAKLSALDSVWNDEEPSYIGLPAYHFECARREFGNIVMVDWCRGTTRWARDFYLYVMEIEPPITIIHDDIRNYLKTNNQRKFNIFDLDLMGHIKPGAPYSIDLSDLARDIHRNSKNRSVVNISSLIGRNNTKKDWKHVMQSGDFERAFLGAGFKTAWVPPRFNEEPKSYGVGTQLVYYEQILLEKE